MEFITTHGADQGNGYRPFPVTSKRVVTQRPEGEDIPWDVGMGIVSRALEEVRTDLLSRLRKYSFWGSSLYVTQPLVVYMHSLPDGAVYIWADVRLSPSPTIDGYHEELGTSFLQGPDVVALEESWSCPNNKIVAVYS